LIGFMIVATAAQTVAEPELDGMYLAEGVNPDGSAYRGLVQIARHGDVHFVTWIMGDGSAETLEIELSSVGLALRDNGMLAVSYYTPDSAGLALYRIEDEGRRLVGRWTIVGGDSTAHAETLTRLRDVPRPAGEERAPDLPGPGKRSPSYPGKARSSLQ
jgi:hypothetical protein